MIVYWSASGAPLCHSPRGVVDVLWRTAVMGRTAACNGAGPKMDGKAKADQKTSGARQIGKLSHTPAGTTLEAGAVQHCRNFDAAQLLRSRFRAPISSPRVLTARALSTTPDYESCAWLLRYANSSDHCA